MLFYPVDASVPTNLKTDRLLLQPLTPAHVELDYAALMDSKLMLRAWSNSDWVRDDFTLEENYQDLSRHQLEHEQREAFTYTVLNPSATLCLGCVYINSFDQILNHLQKKEQLLDLSEYPGRSQKPTVAGCVVSFWVRHPYLAQDLDRHLLQRLKQWFAEDWAFERVIFLTSRQDTRQTQMLQEAGFQLLLSTHPEWMLWEEPEKVANSVVMAE